MSPPPDRQNPDTPADRTLPPVTVGSATRRVPFVEAAIVAISEVLGVDATVVPFRAGDAAVYRIVVPLTGLPVAVASHDTGGATRQPTGSPAGAAATTLTIWPALARVDVVNPMASVTTTGIVAVDLIPGVEAIFRSISGSVTVARNGRVMVRSGDVLGESDPTPARVPGQ